MINKGLLLSVFVALLIGCSNDDHTPNGISESVLADFSVLGEDLENVYQYDFSASANAGQVTNLTLENAISNQFLTLRQVDEVVTFYTFSSGTFSATQRNVRTGDIRTLPDIYRVSDTRSVIWGANSPAKLFFGYYSPRGSSNFGIQMVDINTQDVLELPVEANVQTVYEPLYHNGKLFVAYRDGSANYKAAVLDTESFKILRTWEFGTSIPSIFIERAGDVAVITSVTGNGYLQTLYDFDDLEARSASEFNLNRFFPPGPLNAELIGNRLYYLNFYAQPALVPYGPAVYDFTSGENHIVDIIGIIQDLQQELGANITLTSYRYQAEGRIFLLGYTSDFSVGGFMGGIMVISESGELLEHLETPFVPIYFIAS